MAKTTTDDKRPWICIDCSDRFAKEQTSGKHRTEYRPREPMITNAPRSTR